MFEGEDWGIGILGYESGIQVVVEGNYVTRGGMDDIVEIYGSGGVIKADLTFGSPLSVYSNLVSVFLYPNENTLTSLLLHFCSISVTFDVETRHRDSMRLDMFSVQLRLLLCCIRLLFL